MNFDVVRPVSITSVGQLRPDTSIIIIKSRSLMEIIMNKTLSVLALSVVFGLTACQKEKADTMTVEQVSLETEDQKYSYALGSNLGTYIKQQTQAYEEVGMTLNQDLLVKAVVASLADKSQMEEPQVQETLQAMQTEFREKRQVFEQKAAEVNKTEGMEFLAKNAERPEVTVTDSGLQYEVLQAAEGDKPAASDTVQVHYHGTLINGEVFDSSVQRGQPATFPLNRVISGWTEGLQYMPVGSKYKFYIPSELAYGERAQGAIKANSTLIFEVELLSIETKGGEQ